MRVSQCCCGCSLRTGTLILLWLDLIGQAMSIIQTAAGICTREIKLTFLDSAGLGWGCLVVVITIYGIIGVEKHRPSYLLPYIGRQVFGMVVLVLLTLFMWVGSLAWRDEIVDYIYRSIQMSQDKNKPSEGDIRKRYDAAISMITVILVIGFALSYYFFSVIYSYYQQMQEEDKGIFNRGTGIVYAAPEKGYNDCPPAYAQQPAAVPYAHQQAGYPHLPQNVGYPQQFPDYPQKQ